MIDTVDRWPQSSSEAALQDALIAKGKIVRGKSCQCPWHDDRNPSASIVCGEDGKYRVYCHPCDRWGDIYDITGTKPVADGPPLARTWPRIESDRPTHTKPASRVYDSLASLESAFRDNEGIYKYSDPTTGTVDMIIIRYRKPDGKKAFAQHRPLPGGRWEAKCPDGPLPLYNRSGIGKSTGPVVVVEGEKCVHALHQAGVVGTTSSGGAGKAGKTDWSPLAGRRCILWPDHDPVDPKTGKATGIEHMREVKAILEALDPPAEVLWIDPAETGLPAKGDVADLVQPLAMEPLDVRKAAVAKVLALATGHGADDEVLGQINDIVAGRYKAVHWPWPMLSDMSRALLPGTVTLLCGDPGTSKSFFMLQAAAHWHTQGIKVALYELEEDRRYHAFRALAQAAGDSRVLDPDWVATHEDEAHAIFLRHQAFLSSFGKAMVQAPGKQTTMDSLAEWVRERSIVGCRVIIIDPITAAASSDKPWIDDQRFIMEVKTIVKDHGNSLVLVTHPTKGKPNSGPGQMSGGAAFSRFSQSVLWLSAADGATNRTVHLVKSRNGRGGGTSIGFDFSAKTLRFTEMGVQSAAVGPVPHPPAVPQRSMPANPTPSEDLFG